MIEKTVLDYLETELFPIPVYMEEPESNPRPADTPEKFVIVQKTGSGLNNHLFNATIAVQSYAGTLIEAAELNEAVKEAMLGIIELNSITRIDLNSDYEFTREDTKQPRYQAVFDLSHY